MTESNRSISEYQYTKAIRFNLEECRGSLRDVEKEESDRKGIDFEDFYKNGLEISQDLKDFVCVKDEDNEFKRDKEDSLIYDKLITVKKDWLKVHFKNEFYQNNEIRDSISQIQYVKDGFKEWFEGFEKNLQEIKKLYEKSPMNKKEQKKSFVGFRADISYYLLKISSNKCFGFIRDFVENANHKNDTVKIMNLTKDINKFRKQLEMLKEEYLPSQSVGLCIAKGSMNYYTVNKKPKEYYEEEIKKVEEQLDEKKYYYDKNSKVLQIGKFGDFNFGEKPDCDEIKFLEEYKQIRNSNENKVYFDIFGIKTLMKDLKADIKSLFFELCKKESLENLENRFFLFENKQYIEEVKNLTQKIELNNRANQYSNYGSKLDAQKLKKERGDFLIKRKYFDKETHRRIDNKHFKNWWRLIESFKRISLEYGRLKAQVKGVERERIEAENNKYWVLFLEEKDDKFVLLVHKDDMNMVKSELRELEINKSGSDSNIWVLESLTKRALHKLCFAEESTFASEMKEEDLNLYRELQNVKKATDDKDELEKRKRRNYDERLKSELMLPFLKNVLRSNYAKRRLDLKHFDLTKVFETNNLNDFELELENACYKWRSISISNESLNKLIDNHSIIKCKITSYDLENRNMNTHQTPESNYKRHTEEIWNEFWEHNKSIRINPEIKIHFRKQDEDLRQYLINKDFDLDKIEHRNLEGKYTLTTSFSLNADKKKYSDLAFAKTKDLLEEINKFNDKFNERNWDKERPYKYGIDRGQIELATLCIAKFDKNETYEVNGKTLVKPKFPRGEEDIKCYELKKEFYDKKEKPSSKMVNFTEIKEKRVIANLSYFIDRTNDRNWFNEKTCTCLDLTTAKVIKDKIILNGDVLTFLKLKKEGAKRIIFDDYNPDSILEWDEEKIEGDSIPLNLDGKVIYYFDKRFENLLIKDNLKYTKENIFNSLQEYLKELKEKRDSEHKPSVEKLNHLRDSIVANMIGVISFLQNKYPGFVILEDLNVDTVNKHLEELYISISRRLEFSLFNKFQTIGLVPPHIKNLIEIREDLRKGRGNKLREEIKKETGREELGKKQEKKITNKMKDYSEQFGAIIFVSEMGTSAECPYCEKQWNWDKNNNDKGRTIKDLKLKERRFLCGKHNNSECEFDTYDISGKYGFLEEISNPDKVATYNVAKKIKDYKEIGKLTNTSNTISL